jgi:hypothetical protein
VATESAHVLLDGDDLSDTQTAVNVSGGLAGTPQVTIQNCFIHDSPTGVNDYSGQHPLALTFVNNVLVSNAQALLASSSIGPNVAANNLFVSSSSAGVAVTTGAKWTLRNNAYFDNAADDPSPSPAAGDITADPRLDMQTPPALGAGSPCLGAGDATVAPATDFFARPRAGRVDIGARQDP